MNIIIMSRRKRGDDGLGEGEEEGERVQSLNAKKVKIIFNNTFM